MQSDIIKSFNIQIIPFFALIDFTGSIQLVGNPL